MAKKKKEFKVPNGKNWFYGLVKAIGLFKIVAKKPEIINLAGEIEQKSIVVVNHSNKSGPPGLNLYYPKTTCKWGAYQMFGNYKSRKAYLRDILYIQKCGKKPGFKTSFIASVLGFLNPGIYKGMRMMPSDPDMRLAQTIKNSCKVLDAGLGVMIFPENSNEGYKDVLTEFFPGFVMLAEQYYRSTGVDVPVYPVYYSVKKHVMVIDKPVFVQDLVKQGLNRKQIAEFYCNKVNDLYLNYVINYEPPKKK